MKTNPKEKTKEKRNQCVKFDVTEQERKMIDKRMAQTGMTNRHAYLLKMAIDAMSLDMSLKMVFHFYHANLTFRFDIG